MTRLSSPFVKQTSFEVEYAPAYITKWKSQRTGLQLTYINQPSPVVNGYFAVATEISDDSGSPHTLEHLVFMGSKKYPYKGLLDTLGNRLYSQTNAWTATDQTVYTLTTAGWDGFKTLLPIYLDHLLNPTLTDEACLTEVYHVDGKGKEKGVVFSEMQGIEGQSWFETSTQLQRMLYAPDSGYSSETGGLMAELRHLTNVRIKEFHKSMYRPDNLCVIVTGSIDQDELLQIMTDFDTELEALPHVANKRPFVDSKHDEPLKEEVVKVVEFPETDESTGEVLMAWIGPLGDDPIINTAVDMVGAAFTDSAISLFNKHLVEIDNPYATAIMYHTDDYYRTALNFTCNGVPTEKLSELVTKVKDLIKSQTIPEEFNLLYMRQIINQQRLKFISQTEKSPVVFSDIAILDFIYGKPDGSDLSKWAQNLNEYDELLTWSSDQWCDLIKEYFVDNKCAIVLGTPSRNLNDEMKKQQRELNKNIKNKLGADGLKQAHDKLAAAHEFNDRPIPEELLVAFAKPDPSKVAFIKTNSYKAGYSKGVVDVNTNSYIESDELYAKLHQDTPSGFPLFMHFENFKSQFVTIQLVMASTKLQPHLLKYMSILEEIFSMSMKLPNGEYISYEQVVSDLNRDLIEFQLDNGFNYQFYDLITLSVKCETKKYATAINWIYNIVNFVEFEEGRVKVILEKLIGSLPDKKRDGELMMYSSQFRNLFNDSSLRKQQDSINTESFFKELLQLINDGKFEEIKRDLNEIKRNLFNLDNIKLIVLGDVSSLETPVSSWTKFVAQDEPSTEKITSSIIPFSQLPRSFQFKSELGFRCKSQAVLIDMKATESTHLVSVTPIPTDYLHDDIPRIALTIEFLCAVEGPFWRSIRGSGLAYGVSMKQNIETGFLSFKFYRAADAKQGWIESKNLMNRFANGELPIDALSLENAVAAIVNELANAQESSYDSASAKICDNLFKARGPNYIESFLHQLNQLGADDVRYVLKKYFVKLFDAGHSVVFTSLPMEKIEEMGKFLQGEGYNIKVEEINHDEEEEEEEEEFEQESGDDETVSGSGSDSGSDSDSDSDSDDE
ncbi:hypothetical protein KGF57_000837 [Candida theae]|uniref:Mitochondrial presequence protease n=1 Tax=Candida theae TaxID=1198502 RepID=A0AAD5BI46_9ASCO|nr:uncharacterized protein KGF57_000837 [Candida theae]KAI5965044.1 hypothetical protein KGF57_000837 [Candida theae]